jgi:hypothetical protein
MLILKNEQTSKEYTEIYICIETCCKQYRVVSGINFRRSSSSNFCNIKSLMKAINIHEKQQGYGRYRSKTYFTFSVHT